jgi:hypothetical protein
LCLTFSSQAAITNSIARYWDEEILSAIRIDTPHPPVQARNLFGLSTCMYDAWAAYDSTAVGYMYHGKHTAADISAARREAISYAAYRILKERYAYSRSSTNTLATLDAHMAVLGYNTNNTSLDTNTPAGVGNSVYAAVSAWFINDGARQTNSYADYPPDQGGYTYVNQPLTTGLPGIDVSNINHWQRLAIANAVDQTGYPIGPIQNYLGAQWLRVRPFALTREDETQPWINPAGPPQFPQNAFRSNVVDVIRRSSELTPDDGASIDISPGAFGNNPLGFNTGTGHPLNPATGLPYPANVVKRGDFARVLAEFWADGPSSETPPGHWNVLANAVADNTNFVKQFGGTGPALDPLEWDVKVYFALNAAVHDAACAAWSLKRYYDGWRPISAVRYLGKLGQSTDPSAASYNVSGLPLITNLIELVTSNSIASGRHAGLTAGKIAINTWPGQPANPSTQYSGIKWIHADTWLPFQKTNFVTPAFPGFVSGHSSFSRSAAEVMTAITGSQFFPGGMATYTAVSNTSLSFERGPSQTIQLQWATYFDAADQAGLSRIWGGIHPPVDDVTGRVVGSQAGQAVWALASKYFDGSILNLPMNLTLKPLNPAQCELRHDTVRGLYYKIQSSPDVFEPFTNEPGPFTQATNTFVTRTDTPVGPKNFYRVVRSLTP